MGIIERMGLGIFVQIIMEMSFNLILLIIVLVMLIGINEDKKHSFMRKVSVPYTKTILLFYLFVLGYNVAHVVISCYEGAVTRKAVVLMQIFMFFYFWFGESLTLFFSGSALGKGLKKDEKPFPYGCIPGSAGSAVSDFYAFDHKSVYGFFVLYG